MRTVPARRRQSAGFIDRYIFPDGELVPLSTTLDAVERVGLEVRDVEALREHYGMTLRAWVDNLRDGWDTATAHVPESRARAWLLYLATSALAFEHGNLTVHQVVAVRQGAHGASAFPRTRQAWIPQTR